MFLHAKLPGGFAAAPRRFLARKVAHTEMLRVDHQAAPVDQHLRLSRSGFNHSRPLEHCGHPNSSPIDLSFEVGEDLVVLVHLDTVQLNQVRAVRLLFCGLSV